MTTQLLGIRAENYKRLELVDITFSPEGGVVAIMGANEAGKSSTLDAIETAIAGRKATKTVKPIHTGADSARVVATFDDIVVIRVFKPNGTTQITVTGTDGRKFSNAEEILKSLYSHVALDPLAFSRLSDDDQVATLLPLIGYDPSADDAERATEYELRTIKGRERDRLKGELTAYGDPVPGLPSEEVSVAKLSAELSEALGASSAKNQARSAMFVATGNVERADEAITTARLRVDDLEAALVVARQDVDKAIATRTEKEADLNARRAEWEALPEAVDTAPIEAKIAGAEATNRAIRNKLARDTVAANLATAVEEYAAFTAKIEAVEARKAKALAAAKMPVDGLTIDPETMVLLLNGEPFSQASTGVRIRTGVAIAMALTPDLRLIVIRDASLLDQGNREVIDELAKAEGFLVLMEIADESSPVGVVIEDGNVREVRS